jgi:hypothetical protein
VLQTLLCLVALAFYPDSARLVATGLGGDMIGDATCARVSVRDSRGRLHVVFSKNWAAPVRESSDVFHTFSTDDGLTWSQPQAISRNGDSLSYHPTLAIDSRDHLHCVWFECFAWAAPYFLFDYFYSEYDGTSWSVPLNISQRATYTNAIDHSSVAVDGVDRVHVAYEMAAGMGQPDIYYMYKEDGVWSAPETVSNSTLDDGFPSIAGDASSRVHLCWKQRGDSGRVVYAFRDSAWSVPQPIAAYRYGIDAPSLCVGPDSRLHLAFSGNSSEPSAEVYYTCRQADSWTVPLNVSASRDTQSFGASVVVDSSGCIHVAWIEFLVGQKAQLYYRSRTDSLGAKVNLTSDSVFGSSSAHFGLQVPGGRPDLFWRGTRVIGPTDSIRVYYMRLAAPQALSDRGQCTSFLHRIEVRPNPFPRELQVSVVGAAGRLSAVAIVNAAGRVIRSLDGAPSPHGLCATWDGLDSAGSPVRAGVYFVRLDCAGGPVSAKVVRR